MSVALAHFLGQKESSAAKFVRSAERLCGYPSEDARFLAEMAASAKRKIGGLGLDPLDTKPKELYYGLRSRAAKDSQDYNRLYGFNKHDNPVELLEEIFRYSNGRPQAFALKASVARRLLEAVPPKKLIKKLGYRTGASMLKRENINALYAIVFDVESVLWRRKFDQAIKKISVGDFHEKPVEILVLPKKTSEFSHQSISPVYLTGAIALNPEAKFQISGLYSSLRLIEAAEKLEHWSFAIQQRQLNVDFSKFVCLNADQEPALSALIGDLPITYSHLRRNHQTPAEKLAAISLPMAWWKHNDHLAKRAKIAPISFSLHDLLADYLLQNDYKSRQTSYFSQAFWHKLLGRYLKFASFETEVLKQLNPEPILIEDKELVNEPMVRAT